MNVVTLRLPTEVPVTGEATFLFTDLVDSTALADRLGDERWGAALRAHNRAVRTACAARGGEEVAFLGDGFLLLFADALSALDCAVAIQRAIAEIDVDGVPMRVRAGLHVGAAVREGTDIYGTTVNVASRVTDHARGGEVLVSDRAHDVLKADLPERLEVREVVLKGLGVRRVHGLTIA